MSLGFYKYGEGEIHKFLRRNVLVDDFRKSEGAVLCKDSDAFSLCDKDLPGAGALLSDDQTEKRCLPATVDTHDTEAVVFIEGKADIFKYGSHAVVKSEAADTYYSHF